MKIAENIKIEGAVIDPATSRLCATCADICRALRLAPPQVAATKARRYQVRYWDVLDVLEARSKTPRAGRPKKHRGSAEMALLCALATFALTAFAGVTLWASAMAESKAEIRTARIAALNWNPEEARK